MWFSVALVKFHWFGINWHVLNQSECRNCCLYIIIQKIVPQPNLENTSKYGFPPIFFWGGGGEWRLSEHAHASYGLFFRPGRKESSGTGLPSHRYCQSNRSIILIYVFVKISTNPSSKVRSWSWRLHESDIQAKCNQSFSFLAASRLSRSSLIRRKITRRQKSKKNSGTRVPLHTCYVQSFAHANALCSQKTWRLGYGG